MPNDFLNCCSNTLIVVRKRKTTVVIATVLFALQHQIPSSRAKIHLVVGCCQKKMARVVFRETQPGGGQIVRKILTNQSCRIKRPRFLVVNLGAVRYIFPNVVAAAGVALFNVRQQDPQQGERKTIRSRGLSLFLKCLFSFVWFQPSCSFLKQAKQTRAVCVCACVWESDTAALLAVTTTANMVAHCTLLLGGAVAVAGTTSLAQLPPRETGIHSGTVWKPCHYKINVLFLTIKAPTHTHTRTHGSHTWITRQISLAGAVACLLLVVGRRKKYRTHIGPVRCSVFQTVQRACLTFVASNRPFLHARVFFLPEPLFRMVENDRRKTLAIMLFLENPKPLTQPSQSHFMSFMSLALSLSLSLSLASLSFCFSSLLCCPSFGFLSFFLSGRLEFKR